MFAIQPATLQHADQTRAFIAAQWGAPQVVVHDTVYEPHTLPGFVAVQNDEWFGLITYHVGGDACAVVTLKQRARRRRRRHGVDWGRDCGSAAAWLLPPMADHHQRQFARAALPQKWGFLLVVVHRGAVARARQSKRAIPLIGNDGLPLHDEIELELIV